MIFVEQNKELEVDISRKK